MSKKRRRLLVPLRPLGSRSRLRSFLESPRFRSSVITLIVAVAVAAAGVWGFRALWRYVIDLKEFRLVPGEQELRDLSGRPLDGSPWVEIDNLRAQWLGQADEAGSALRRPVSLFAPKLTERIYAALVQSPWLRPGAPGEGPPVRVRRRFPNRLEIRLRLRQPAFRVADPKYTYLVDDEGVVLDPTIFRVTDALKERPVLRFSFDPGVPEPGKRWADEGVRGAMHLLRVLDDSALLGGFAVAEVLIDEAARGTTGSHRLLALVPSGGGRIIWGSPPFPGKIPSPAEATPEEKFRNLVEVLPRYKGALPQFVVDLRLRTPTVRPVEP